MMTTKMVMIIKMVMKTTVRFDDYDDDADGNNDNKDDADNIDGYEDESKI